MNIHCSSALGHPYTSVYSQYLRRRLKKDVSHLQYSGESTIGNVLSEMAAVLVAHDGLATPTRTSDSAG